MTTLRAYGDGTYGGGTYGGGDRTLEPRWVIVILGADGQWVDVSCDVRGVSIDQARSDYVEAFSAATATIELANDDDRYSTWAPDNVWTRAGGWVTAVPIRVGTAWLGDIEWLFTGTTDSVGESWPSFSDAVAVVTATDAFKNLARVDQPARAAVGGGELTGARVGRILADVGYTGPTAIDAGTVAVAATTLEGLAIDQLRVVGETEWGWLYTNGAGALVFRGRTAVDTDPRMTGVQFTFTDHHELPGACYADATTLQADDTRIINRATVIPPALAPQVATDAASVAHFGLRTWDRDDLPFTTAPDALGLAQALVLAYKSDEQRIDSIVIDAAGRPDAWPAAHGARIADRVRFVRVLPGGGQVDAELLVLARTDRMRPAGDDNRIGEWQVTLATADAAYVAGVCRWDLGTWDECQWGV